jgi:hypothetical protein
MQSYIPVNPYNIVKTYNIDYIIINVTNIQLNQSADVQVVFCDNTKFMVDVVSFTLSGEDYQNWGSNDDYIINYVCSKYNISLLQPP